jgi:hypothetical protein
MSIPKSRIVHILFIACLMAGDAAGQDNPVTFDRWFDQRVDELVQEAEVDSNSRMPDRQRDSPSSDSRSTSLVDQTSASDFVSVALSVLPIAPRTEGGPAESERGADSSSVTISAYSLMAFASGKDLTDPVFYKAHTRARGVYFTLGTSASEIDNDNSDRAATVLGAKWLVVNQRDLYAAVNQQRLAAVEMRLKEQAASQAALKQRIKEIMYAAVNRSKVGANGIALDEDEFVVAFSDANFPMLLADLPAETLEQINELLIANLQPYQRLQQTIDEAFEEIRNGQQLAFAYSTNFRRGLGNDDHRFTILYDYGLSSRVTWVVNASADYKDRKTLRDSYGARIATEFLGALTPPQSTLWGRPPITLSFSGEARAEQYSKPTFTVQAKLTIPIALGIDLPLVYRYASLGGNSNEADAQARFGLTVDIGRLSEMLWR